MRLSKFIRITIQKIIDHSNRHVNVKNHEVWNSKIKRGTEHYNDKKYQMKCRDQLIASSYFI